MQCQGNIKNQIQYSDLNILESFSEFFGSNTSWIGEVLLTTYFLYYAIMMLCQFYVVFMAIKFIILQYNHHLDISIFRELLMGKVRLFLVYILIGAVIASNIGLQFEFGVNLSLLINGKITPMMIPILFGIKVFEFCIITLLLLYSLINNYSQNLYVTLASLGVPEDTDFMMPCELKTQKSLLLPNIYSAFTLLYLAMIYIFSKIVFDVDKLNCNSYDLSRMVSLSNQKNLMTQSDLALRQNTLLQYARYFDDRIDLYNVQFQRIAAKQNLLQKLVNFDDYGNVTQQFLLHDLADSRWRLWLDSHVDKALLSYNEQNRPSFIYGNNNFSEFQRLKPPRTRKIGPHLQNNNDGMNVASIQAAITLQATFSKMFAGNEWRGMMDVYLQLSPTHDMGSLLSNANEIQQFVMSQQKAMNTDLPLFSLIVNQRAYDLINEDIISMQSRDVTQLLAFIVGIVLCFVFLVMAFLFTSRKVQEYKLKSNLFLSLFVKKILGLNKLQDFYME